MSWDDLLGVAVRNLNACLEAEAENARLRKLVEQITATAVRDAADSATGGKA